MTRVYSYHMSNWRLHRMSSLSSSRGRQQMWLQSFRKQRSHWPMQPCNYHRLVRKDAGVAALFLVWYPGSFKGICWQRDPDKGRSKPFAVPLRKDGFRLPVRRSEVVSKNFWPDSNLRANFEHRGFFALCRPVVQRKAIHLVLRPRANSGPDWHVWSEHKASTTAVFLE